MTFKPGGLEKQSGPLTTEYAALPEPFQFYRMMLEGDHLHFGYWPEDRPAISLEDAQEELFERLTALIPPPPARLLDVGCGLGLSAFRLGDRGYFVTAIAPSPELIGYAAARYAHENIHFEAAGFLDESAIHKEQTFDVILFQESLQYLHPLDLVLQSARELLHPTGKLIICDEMVIDEKILDHTSVHPARDVHRLLTETGFRLETREAVGPRVSKTCTEMIDRFHRFSDAMTQAIGLPETENRIRHYQTGWQSQQCWYESGRMGYEFIAAKKDPVHIRPAREEEDREILPLFNRLFGTVRTIDHWRWKYRENPFGNHHIAAGISDDGIIAGTYCGYPVPFYSCVQGNRRILAYQAGDTMTNPAFRSSGLGKNSVLSRIVRYYYDRFCVDRIPFIYGFNTGNIRKFGERFLNYRYISDIPFWVLENPAEKISSAFEWKNRVLGYRVNECDSITDEYDRFFDRVGRHYGMLIERKAPYLKWRYLDCPDRVHRFLAIRKWGKLVGWSVFRQKGDTLVWGDALFDPSHPHSVTILVSEAIRTATEPVRQITGWFSRNPAWWTTLLGRYGFTKIPEPNNLAPCFSFFNLEFDGPIFENHWYYTMGDSDLF